MKEKFPSSSFRKISQIYSYLLPYKAMLLGVFLSLIVTSISVLGISQALRFFIDEGIASKNFDLLDKALVLLITAIVILATFTFGRFYFITMIGEKVVTDLRRDIYRKILSLPPSFLEKHKSGQILSHMTSDTTVLLTVIGSSLSVALRNIVTLFGGVILLISTSGKLAIFLLVIIPLVITPIMIVGKRLRAYSKESQDKIADLASQCDQTLSSIKVVQAYLREDFEEQNFQDKLTEQMSVARKRIMLRGILTFIIIFLVFGGIATVLWIGGKEVISGTLSAGELSAFIYIGIVCAGAVAALSDVMGDVQKAAGATDRIFEFLNFKANIVEKNGAIKIPLSSKGKIEFKNVTFGYEESKKPILNNINFTIEPNKITALVGKSGAGKTTIFNLLERFYDITSGQILFDKTEICNIRINSLRSQFTYVSQDAAIFSTTAYENILYGNPSATKKQVIEAAKLSGSLEFIEKLPNGFDTYLGDKGMKLSGGQKQRISIARAILNNPKILLLDEATSSLDSENELLVTKALEHLMKGRTTIVIAHRLSTVQKADVILVLDNGKIIEQGSHKDLIAKPNGIYKKLAKLQLGIK